jgi:hypothetical protein
MPNFKEILKTASCAALVISLLMSAAAPLCGPYSYAQDAKKKKAAQAKVKPGAAAQKKAGKAAGEADETKPAAAAGTKIIRDSAGAYIDNALAQSANADILGLLNGAVRIISAEYAGESVRLSAYCTVTDGDSSEMNFMYSKNYGVEASVKSEYASKYASADYFTFESDFLGCKGYQIVGKASARSHIDMLCYQVGTDSVFVAYAAADPKIPGNKARPKLTMEGGFLRSAIVAAIDFENSAGFSFFETNLLKKFKPRSGGGAICAQTSIAAGNSQLVMVYTYKNSQAASDAFKNFTLTRGETSVAGDNHKKDAEYNYYLNSAFILAVSNKLYQ